MSEGISLDERDGRLLAILQEDADVTISELGEMVNLSTNACWRRIRRLEEAGYIRKKVALLDPVKVGVGTTAFVAIGAAEHTEAWLNKFTEIVSGMSEIVECYRMSGQVDYLLKVKVPDISSYDIFYKNLINSIRINDVSSTFAMEEMKYTTALPLDEIGK
ncbi:MAG: Lrp/AsnC family transcriptional regulator [Sphingobium sp.]